MTAATNRKFISLGKWEWPLKSKILGVSTTLNFLVRLESLKRFIASMKKLYPVAHYN
jgi:hypothetical protein